MAEACLTPDTKAIGTVSAESISGIRVRPATSHDKGHHSLKSPLAAVITWINPSGPLGCTGLEVNDIILGINGWPVKDAQDIMHILRSHVIKGGLIVRALDHRTGRRGYIQLPIP